MFLIPLNWQEAMIPLISAATVFDKLVTSLYVFEPEYFASVGNSIQQVAINLDFIRCP